MVGVGADVAEDEGGAGAFGGEFPAEFGGEFTGFDRGAHAGLEIVDLDGAQIADDAGGEHGAGLADHRVAGIGVGEAEDVAFGGFGDGFGIGEGVGQRFVADDVNAGGEGGCAVREVAVIGGHDGDGVEIGVGEHGGDIGIAGEAEVGGGRGGCGGVGGQDAGCDLEMPVEQGGGAVDGADEAAGPAADDAEAQAAAEGGQGVGHGGQAPEQDVRGQDVRGQDVRERPGQRRWGTGPLPCPDAAAAGAPDGGLTLFTVASALLPERVA